MTTSTRVAAALALGSLLLATLLWNHDDRALSPTSFGRVPGGFGAVFDLLTVLDLPVSRSLRPVTELDTRSPVWWLAAPVLCDDVYKPGPDVWAMLDWTVAGGTAIVALPPAQVAACTSFGGLALPRRTGVASSAVGHGVADGPLLPRRRSLEPAALATFVPMAGWQPVATIGTNSFVVERRVGAGLLVVVADARVFANQWLDAGDNASFVLDLVRGYGTPRFDEYGHGFRRHESAAAYLLGSPAVVVFVGLGLLALLYVWRSRLLPERGPEAGMESAPVLGTYVDSLAKLLVASRDPQRFLDAYRRVTALRLRRHLGLAATVPLAVLAERLRASGRAREADVRLFSEGANATRASDARALAHRLDRLLWEATR